METASPLELYLGQLRGPAAARAQSALARLAALLGGGATPVAALPWHALPAEPAAAVRLWATLCHPVGQANALLTALRGVLRWAARTGQVDAEDAAATLRALGRDGGAAVSSLRVGRPVANRSLQALIDVCAEDHGPVGLRDAALVAVMAGGGLTAAAASRLDWRDFDRERCLLLVRTGRRAGRAVLVGGTSVARRLDGWAGVVERNYGPIFVTVDCASRPLSAAGVAAVVRRRAGQAGLGRLAAGDLAASYRWQLGRLTGRDPLRPSCSLLDLDDGGVWLATPCLDPAADLAADRSRRAG